MLGFAPVSSFTGLNSRCVSPVISPRRSPHPSHRRTAARCALAAGAIVNKSYQLEEDEDSFSCTSAVYLSEDGTLSIGRTDGPKPDKVDASWTYSDRDGELLLQIERHFGSDATPFSVKRILRGHLDDTRKNLEGLPIFEGAMYQEPTDFSPHSEVGWFAMILAVDDLPQDDFDISTSG